MIRARSGKVIPEQLTPCDGCGLPVEIHLGYDHGRRKCLVASSTLDLSLIYDRENCKAMLKRFADWVEKTESREWAEANMGAGI
jgi:hypothetical protein